MKLGGRTDETSKALEIAKERFRDAGRRATEAFGNKELEIPDRLLALEFRVVATLLEFLDNPKVALRLCKLSLEELHGVSTVQKSFDAALKNGFRAKFRKKDRIKVIANVCKMNRMIYDFANISFPSEIVMLPCIDVGTEKLDPIRDRRIAQLLEEHDIDDLCVQWSFGQKGADNHKLKCALSIATDIDGNYLIADYEAVKVFDGNGNFQVNLRQRIEAMSCACDVATSSMENKIFVLEEWKVQVFNNSANLELMFPVERGSLSARLAVTCSKVVVLRDYKVVDVYHAQNGGYVRSFGEGIIESASGVTASNDGCVMVMDSGRHCVHLFSVEGKLLRTRSLQAIAHGEIYFDFACDAAGEHIIVAGLEGKTVPIIDVYLLNSGRFVQRIQLDQGKAIFPAGITVSMGGQIAIALTEGFSGKVVVV